MGNSSSFLINGHKQMQLKSFLKEPGGVDLYKNVEVRFISGRKAVLTIFNDGRELEKITLSDYDDKKQLHELFKQKGFDKHSESELQQRRASVAEKPITGRGPVDERRREESKRLRKERVKQLKMARENYMTVGYPIDEKI